MLRIVFILIVFMHGLTHFMGFAKAFHYGHITQLSKEISKPLGLLWMAAAILFMVSGVSLLAKKDNWWLPGVAAVLLSQALIFTSWQDARFGTIANVIVLIAGVLSWGSWNFAQSYEQDVSDNLALEKVVRETPVSEEDLQHLPLPVQRYLRYAGVLNKPKVYNYKICFEGQMRDKGKDWFPFVSEQYNFTTQPTRLFFMKAKMFGVTVPGYHAYKNGHAAMQVKFFGLIPVVNAKAGHLDKAETVTLFNDMCILAPATLIDKNIRWEPIDDLKAKAIFTVGNNRVTAILYFNEQNQLVNFTSNDRFAIGQQSFYPFSTPVGHYQNFNGYNLPAYGEAVWHYPDGAFAYGKFFLKSVAYNVHL
jgi:predicted cobalt transporter CbtA